MNKDDLFVRLLFLPFFNLDLSVKCAKASVCLYKNQNVCTSSWIARETVALSFVCKRV